MPTPIAPAPVQTPVAVDVSVALAAAAFRPIHFQALKERLREQLPDDSYAAWFAPLAWAEAPAGEIRLLAENEFARHEIELRYAARIGEIASQLGFTGHPLTLGINGAEGPAVLPYGPASPPLVKPSEKLPPPPGAAQRAGLISRFTFDRFEEGSNNLLAHAASRRTAEVRGTYNPLFIWGGSGFGKTHLLHAVGHEHLRRHPDAKLILTTGQGFMTDYTTATRLDGHDKFKARYWLAEVLLIDDVHILARGQSTMQAFFEVFNAIHENGGQIVLTSDQPPRKIEGLEERLRTRFEWGMLADIQPYPLEMRVKILKRKAEEQLFDLPDDAAWFMASRLQKNVRELEGALEKVKLTAELRAEPAGLELAREALAGDLPQAGRQLSMEKIVEQVAAYFHLAPRDLTGPSKLKKISEARHVAVFLVNRMTGLSNAEIARRLGDRNPSTIHHALKKVELQIHQDPDYATRLEALEQQMA